MAPQNRWACSGCGRMLLVICKLCHRASQCPNCDADKHGEGVCTK